MLHRTAYRELGLTDWRYDSYEIDESGLADFLAGLDDQWRGLSLTMPLKRVALDLCDEVSELARRVNAVNTVVLTDGRRYGTNTDVPGVVSALRERGIESARSAVVLGAGATAGSALAGLVELGVTNVTSVVRNPARADELRDLAGRLDVGFDVVTLDHWDRVAPADVGFSTVPEEAAAAVADALVARANVVFDALYDPWPTRLASAAGAAGRTVVNGFDLLIHQAGFQVELMTGRSPAPVAAMRTAGTAALD